MHLIWYNESLEFCVFSEYESSSIIYQVKCKRLNRFSIQKFKAVPSARWRTWTWLRIRAFSRRHWFCLQESVILASVTSLAQRTVRIMLKAKDRESVGFHCKKHYEVEQTHKAEPNCFFTKRTFGNKAGLSPPYRAQNWQFLNVSFAETAISNNSIMNRHSRMFARCMRREKTRRCPNNAFQSSKNRLLTDTIQKAPNSPDQNYRFVHVADVVTQTAELSREDQISTSMKLVCLK